MWSSHPILEGEGEGEGGKQFRNKMYSRYVSVLAVATERLFLILEKEKRTFIIIISSSKEDEILV
jgi:hypothetical protein